MLDNLSLLMMNIELKQIHKYYAVPDSTERREVLRGIDLNIRHGDSMAVVGPSGSGKSTLLNIMGTLDKPSSGSVFFDGEAATGMNDDQLALIRNRKIGFVFQVHHLLPQLTMLENVLLPVMPSTDRALRKNASRRAMELLDSVGLAGKTTQRPGQLSVGECQRTAVVRALMNEPEILLADEPTGSLDNESAAHLGELLVKINAEQQVALVVVTHSMELAARMKNVLHLQNGKLIS